MLALRDGGVDLVRQGVLIYPMLSPTSDSESHMLFGDGRFGLSTARLDWFWRSYVDTEVMLDDPRVAPLMADLDRLPPQLILAAELDPLRDDALRLAERLDEIGIPNRLSIYNQLPHGFVALTRFVSAARGAASEVAETLKTSLLS
jgi:acetyl esterase